MTAYNNVTLQNLYIQKETAAAVKKKLVTNDESTKIREAHPVDLYTPNLFVKIGLGFLTGLIALCASGLFLLIFQVGDSIRVFLFFMAIVSYVVLEIMTGEKKHYNSGVDNVLMIICATLMVTAISFNDYGSNKDLLMSFTLLVLSTYFALRFADSFAACVAVVSLLSFIFLAYVHNEATMYTVHYLLIIISAIAYYFSNKFLKNNSLIIYREALFYITVAALLSFYFSGNFYVVNSLAKNIYVLQSHTSSLGTWFLWLWTMIVPIVYLAIGIKRQNILLLRLGAILVAASILTFRYYHSIMSPEAAMIIGGSLLLVISYTLMQLLALPKHGFVFDKYNQDEENNNFEALIPVLLPGAQKPAAEGTELGGGSFGGAGAGGNY
ncbi:MAG TPA: hypothetical protein VF623_01285 [Segetibacter sp.]